MPQNSVIDNTNLINMCRDCGAVGFLPEVTYAYDAAAKTVTVTGNGTDIPAGDALTKMKVKVHDMFGNTVAGQNADGSALVVSTATLNASKPLALSVTLITDDGIIADGGAYGLQAAGDVANWDVQKNAANEL